ncbi:hypothetical protein H6P81_004364 [Aristolochia fimbriata]|uniref:IMS import disulfide relay-system CHCH-CHCH-like Cx9C domain-containing protein n=1 Tax=Aristolochia fimbriata TaxID=158543 RepID=A0AAV7FHU1_ARIFI|nr:hypothetical protein H6P81_004364 [Aristolochia fimbriata]
MHTFFSLHEDKKSSQPFDWNNKWAQDEVTTIEFGCRNVTGTGRHGVLRTPFPSGGSGSRFSSAVRLVGGVGAWRSKREMKERKAPSVLKRFLINCSSQAQEYGVCISQKVPEIERDMCSKEFLALKACMQNVLRGKA